MRARFKGPSGTGILELPDVATVKDVFDELRSRSGVPSFSIKYGLPMAMKTLDNCQDNCSARSLGLHGETLTIVPDGDRTLTSTSPFRSKQEPANLQSEDTQVRQSRTQSNQNPEDVNVPWPGREGTLRMSSLLSPLSSPLCSFATRALVPLLTRCQYCG